MSFVDRVHKLKINADKVIKEAYAKTPEKYHHYITLLEQGVRLANKEMDIRDGLKSLGVYAYNGKTYLRTRVPYMTVDGRMAMAVDEAMEKGVNVEIGPPDFKEVGNQTILTVRVRTARGVSYGTAKVGFGGTGVDSTNPIENAESSAIGRALGFLGYGLIGTGVATAEEVQAALKERESKKEANKMEPIENPISDTETSKSNNLELEEKEDTNASSDTKELGVYQFILQSIRLIPKGEDAIWQIAAQRKDSDIVSNIFIDPELDFESLKLAKGQEIEIELSQIGKALVASRIKKIEEAS